MKPAVSVKPKPFYCLFINTVKEEVYVSPNARLCLCLNYHVYLGFYLHALKCPVGISAWDLVGLRFLLAFLILMPVLIYKRTQPFVE